MKLIRTRWDTPKGKLYIEKPVTLDAFNDLPVLDIFLGKIKDKVREMTELDHCSKLIFVEVNDYNDDDMNGKKDNKLTELVKKKLNFNT